MLELAGAKNAVTAFEGYRPLSAEAALVADADFILFTKHGLDSVGGPDAVKRLPALSATRAVKSGNIISIDDLLLLGFGPRVAEGERGIQRLTRPGSK